MAPPLLLLLLSVLAVIISEQSAMALIGRSRTKLNVNSVHPSAPSSKIAGSSPSQVNAGDRKRKSRRAKIKHDEKVVFFPTAARRAEDGTSWDIPIHGWIFEPETTDLARR